MHGYLSTAFRAVKILAAWLAWVRRHARQRLSSLCTHLRRHVERVVRRLAGELQDLHALARLVATHELQPRLLQPRNKVGVHLVPGGNAKSMRDR